MPYSGSLETRPLLDVIQILAYSAQTGMLTVKSPSIRGLVIFHEGNVVCAYSPSTLDLLVKAAKATEPNTRLSLRRIQVLTALRELFDLSSGDYRFVPRAEPVHELEGLDVRSFYRDGALETGDLLLVLAKAMEDGAPEVAPAASPKLAEFRGVEERRYPRFGPIVLEAKLVTAGRSFGGFLMNMSEGGTFFHADELPGLDTVCEISFELPWELGACRGRARVVWLRAGGAGSRRGAGLAFLDFDGDGRERIKKYLENFEELASDVDFEA